MPEEVKEAIVTIVKGHKEAIVKQEHGNWVVVEVIRRVSYNENKSNK